MKLSRRQLRRLIEASVNEDEVPGSFLGTGFDIATDVAGDVLSNTEVQDAMKTVAKGTGADKAGEALFLKMFLFDCLLSLTFLGYLIKLFFQHLTDRILI